MNNINIDKLHQSPKSAKAVCKVLEQIGIKGITLWKDRSTKHYIFSSENWCLSSETIYHHDLRLEDYTLLEWLGEFYHKALESNWNEEFTHESDEINPAFNRLENYLIEWGYLSKAL
jgi:hypothetical protein